MMAFARGRSVSRVVVYAVVIACAAAGASLAQVEVSGTVSGTTEPGGAATATAVVDITDGSTVTGYSWSQVGGVAAVLTNTTSATVSVALGSRSAYKTHLLDVIDEPPIAAEDLPENVPLPEGQFPAGLQDRFVIQGLNHFVLEEAGLVELRLEVTTTSGVYSATVEVHTDLPWRVAGGIRNVPLGVPVLLQGKEQASYDWMLSGPGGSSSALVDPTTRNPDFTPDVSGMYTVTVTDDNQDPPAEVRLDIYAGTYAGVIVGQDGEGRPTIDPACTVCHNDTIAPDVFADWRQTGHAEILSQNIETNSHYSTNCFECHTVGYNTDAANGGIDEATDFAAFLAADLFSNPVPNDNWTTMLADYPASAKLANIQCENCHGPQNSMAHPKVAGEPRINLGADTCAVCHGEPLRHARFQQWQLSGHSNYELAVDEGQSGNCSRCHTVNGFLEWLPVLLDSDPATDPTASITVSWTEDETHPQTCVACHDPHDIGTVSGNETNANVYITGDTPPLIAGFQATNVGKGALCMTCHNTRRGLRNDTSFPSFFGTGEAARAPHGGAQADVLMGQNAYLVSTGAVGSHGSEVENTCVTCHMEVTDPPDILSYNNGGTNHTFFAREDICSECHSGLTAAIIQAPVESALGELKTAIEGELADLMASQIAAGNTIDLGGQATVSDAGDILAVDFGETRGRQAMTVTLPGDTVIGPLRLNDVDVVPSGGTPFDLYDVADPNLIKAGWNWNLVNNDGSKGVHNPNFVNQVLANSMTALGGGALPCVADATTLCLTGGRFKVEVAWADQKGMTGQGMTRAFDASDSGLLYFFDRDNLEMLVKVLNGCSLNNHYWVFFAATTDVEFTLTVTDTDNGAQKIYTNPLGQAADAITDTAAFATCP